MLVVVLLFLVGFVLIQEELLECRVVCRHVLLFFGMWYEGSIFWFVDDFFKMFLQRILLFLGVSLSLSFVFLVVIFQLFLHVSAISCWLCWRRLSVLRVWCEGVFHGIWLSLQVFHPVIEVFLSKFWSQI